MLRQVGVPGSDVAADAERARQALARIACAARDCVFSHAQFDGETPRRPSGALDWSACESAVAPSLFERWRPATPAPVEAVPPDVPVPLSTAALASQRGGTGILAAQAACAFKAFAQFRLLAAAIEDAEPGVDPRLRGEIAHLAMARLWQRLRSQAQAQHLSAAEREEAVADAIEAALDQVLLDHQEHDGRPRALEARRLQRLVRQSLAQDLARAPFDVVAIEARHELTLGPLPLVMRVDRVDRLAHGGELILDYKTGKVQRKDWALPRPLAPQLLAYALARDAAPLAGIGFAQLRPGDCRLVTEPRAPRDDAASTAALAARRDEWHTALSGLATQFVAGVVALNPRDGATTCQRCGFQVLCRVHEQPPSRPAATSEEDDADEP